MLKELDEKLTALEEEWKALEGHTEGQEGDEALHERKTVLRKEIGDILEQYRNLKAGDRVYLARHPQRPCINEYIAEVFDDFFEMKGDRQCRDDGSIIGGIATFRGIPVTVIGHKKGRNLEENLKCNFGMPGPEGYRKALRLMKQAEKFGRPIITFIDTPGAYPGLEAEARGQGEAIARNLAEMSAMTVPILAIVTGEGSSGGALALGVANSVMMLENAIYAILSPEGFASILWKDASRGGEASEIMKLTAYDLKHFGVIDRVLPEPLGGAHRNPQAVFQVVSDAIAEELAKFRKMSGAALAADRYKKFRRMGAEVKEDV